VGHFQKISASPIKRRDIPYFNDFSASAFGLAPNLHILNFAKNAKVYDGRVAHSSPLLA
jgi:hypothetical protein